MEDSTASASTLQASMPAPGVDGPVANEPVDSDPAAEQGESVTLSEEPAPAKAQAEAQEAQQSTPQDAAEPKEGPQAAKEAAGPAPSTEDPSTEEALPAQDVEHAPAAENPAPVEPGEAPVEPQEVFAEQPASVCPKIVTADAETEAEEAPIQLLSPAAEGNVKPAPLSSQSEASIREYLDNTVVPVLRDGLRMLVKERPEDPCNYLMDYIKANHP